MGTMTVKDSGLAKLMGLVEVMEMVRGKAMAIGCLRTSFLAE